MTPELYAKVKELFLEVRDLDAESREEVLRRECGANDTLRHEVTSLLSYDSAESIMVGANVPPARTGQRIGRPRGRYVGRIERAAATILHRLFRSLGRQLLVISVALLLLVALAVWMYTGMKQATESIAATELKTILNADVTALELWIEEKKKDIQLLSSRTEIRDSICELVDIAETEEDPVEKLRASSALATLRKASANFDRIVGRPERDAVLSRDGMVLVTSSDDSMIGMRLNNEGIAALVPVFQGETLFLEPHPNGAFRMDEIPDLNTPVVHVVAPVRCDDSEDSEIVAAAAFGFPADDEFTRILSVARQGQTGETYIFDDNGLLLSESRFDDELRASGLLPNDPSARSIFRIEIRSPGSGSSEPASSIEAAARPLTRMAATAIAAGRKGREFEQHGVILQPYLNYRGQRVIGAWRWLGQYGFGVTTEVEVDEQYAPMRFPVIAEWIRFGMLAGCVLSLLAAAGWIAMLGRDVEQARQLGQYTLEERIGDGGMGIVYRARHALLQRPTAIKLLHPEMVNESSLARFEREVQLASGLTHPNTIDIYDFGTTPEGSFYCVMEFLQGRTLEQIGRAEGALPATRAVNILSQIAGSLNEAHERGLVHRDVKPSNIMLCEQGGIPDYVKVLDFGLARTVDQSDASNITAPGLVAGTPSYLAPERITAPALIDPRSDIYSFGAVGYFLVSGRRVYDSADPVELLRQIVKESPPRPSEVTGNEIPQDLEDLIVRCLARSPEERPANMLEVIESLARIRAALAPNQHGV